MELHCVFFVRFFFFFLSVSGLEKVGARIILS